MLCFSVDSKYMLIGSDNSGFLGGGPAGLFDNSSGIDAEFFEYFEKKLSVSAGTDHAHG